ncbi:hypothetical protein PAEPH01_1461 [Pancytospora epiphaga]|nr:hypothetical protein PAEPH01_1461 [Pancytospora epiphaga]
MRVLGCILRILPIFCREFYLKAVDRFDRLIAVKNNRLELVTPLEADRDRLRTTFYLDEGRVISGLGSLCGQKENENLSTLYICRYMPYNNDWYPYVLDDDNTVQISNKERTKCFEYSTRFDLPHNYIKETDDCFNLKGTRFKMVYKPGHPPVSRQSLDKTWN